MQNRLSIYLNREMIIQNGMTFFLNQKMIMRNGIFGISVGAYCIRPIKTPSRETYDQNPDTYGAYSICPYPNG